MTVRVEAVEREVCLGCLFGFDGVRSVLRAKIKTPILLPSMVTLADGRSTSTPLCTLSD